MVRPASGRNRLLSSRTTFSAAALSLLLLLAGCGTIIPDIPDMIVTNQRVAEADQLLASDPLGPIPRPQLPPDLAAAPPPSDADAVRRGSPVRYRLTVSAPGGPDDLDDGYRKVNDLDLKLDTPLDSELGLMRRLRASLGQGQDYLRSLGYYEGTAEGVITRPPSVSEDARAGLSDRPGGTAPTKNAGSLEPNSPRETSSSATSAADTASAADDTAAADASDDDASASSSPSSSTSSSSSSGARGGQNGAGTSGNNGQAPPPPTYSVEITLTAGPMYYLEPGELIVSDDPLLKPNNDEPAVDPATGQFDDELYLRTERTKEEHLRTALEAREAGRPAGGGICPRTEGGRPCPAGDLISAGLKPGAPARAADVLEVVDNVERKWRDDGYPQAEIVGTRYSIDPVKKTLLAQIILNPGPYLKMGGLVVRGDDTVNERFLRHNVNWREGQNWSEDAAERYREILLQTGLFKSVEAKPAGEPDASGNTALEVTLEAAPRRTVSGSLNYDSDWGPGVSVAWENRNLSGWGDSLRVELPYWKDLVQLGLNYQRPFVFNNRDQSLLVEGYLLREDTENYELSSISAAAGFERRLNRRLRARLQTSLELGTLDERMDGRRRYQVVGFPFNMYWNNADSYLDATHGLRASLLLSPYYGNYLADFKVVKYRLEASFYRPLALENRLVLALRAMMGSILGTGPEYLPSSLRFFGGGGQSVRGYEYQSIGPRNARNRPAGGATVGEISGELRWRFSKTMGVVAFVDGGMVYERADISQMGQDFLWGGGLGFRYYSPVGPFRLDLATPLTPREEDGPLQLYLSLGQSF
ncbi:MAG: BamA/TamA family outer membrane protein [Deltaproteobacteria bacterium]|jgi:translocation and assembly module TamA|nr:BamA/TamA family outer membrane protein [Deltaproteobacteria bacterium]